MLFNTFTRSKLLQFIIIAVFTSILVACNSGSVTSQSTSTTSSITISSFTESQIAVGESTMATVSLTSSNWSSLPVIVNFINNNESVISLAPESCSLTQESNSCNVTVTGTAAGSGSFSATAVGITSVTSAVVTVNAVSRSGIFFGNNAGLAYMNASLLTGTSQTATIDSNNITGAVINGNNNLYVSTTSGKVYNYVESSALWVTVPGTGAGYTLDGSIINVLSLNNNMLYAGTAGGNVFVYSNNQWNRVGTNISFNQIQTLTFDESNIPYIGTQSGQVYKYLNNSWKNLTPDGSVDNHNSQINSLAISESGVLYAATAYNDSYTGQVYQFNSLNSQWHAISSFSDQSVNSLVIFNDVLYAGISVDSETGNVQKHNSGSSWTQLSDQPGTTPVGILLVNNGELYAATLGNSTLNGQVYHYNDSEHWDRVSTLSNGQVTALTVHNSTYFAGTSNPNAEYNLKTMYQYTESTQRWDSLGGVNSIDSSSVIFSTAVDSSGNFYAGTLYNVYKYNTTIKQWLPIAVNNVDNSGISTIAIYHGIIYAVTFLGNVLYNYNSSDWVLIHSLQSGGSLFSALSSTGKLYIGNNIDTDTSTVGNVWQYNNVSNIWTRLTGNGESGSLDGSTVQSIATDRLDNVYVGTGAGLVWKYPESGSSWELVGIGSPDSSSILSITTDSNNYVYVGTNNGNVYKYTGVIWSELGVSSVDGSLINTVTFDASGVLYALTGAGNVWQYSSSDNSWTNKNYANGIVVGTNTTPTASGF